MMSLAHLIGVPSSRPPPPAVAHLFHAVLSCRWRKDLVLIPAGCEVAMAPNPKATRVPTVFRRATDAKDLVIIPSGSHLPIGRPFEWKTKDPAFIPPGCDLPASTVLSRDRQDLVRKPAGCDFLSACFDHLSSSRQCSSSSQ
ncbi:unnamed protein product [Sphagnum jensenii]|uniref:Uncharacterized protein n=1 Tax=Sphagnum jensenii TaxID=128206 RepID=A0ABP0VXA5_9BRYO